MTEYTRDIGRSASSVKKFVRLPGAGCMVATIQADRDAPGSPNTFAAKLLAGGVV